VGRFAAEPTFLAVFVATFLLLAVSLAALVLLAVFVALRLAGPAFVAPFLALAGLLQRFERDLVLPTTIREPIVGVNVDSSPVDHFTCKRDPITPVTTPSRGAWLTFVDATCTRSPMSAICTSVLVAGIWSPMLAPLESGRGRLVVPDWSPKALDHLMACLSDRRPQAGSGEGRSVARRSTIVR